MDHSTLRLVGRWLWEQHLHKRCCIQLPSSLLLHTVLALAPPTFALAPPTFAAATRRRHSERHAAAR
jgi:hypothetical protein